MSQALLPFKTVGASETVIRTFDFSPGLADGETLTELSATCEIDVLSGTDEEVDTRIINGPTITGTVVSVLIGNLVDGATYRVRCDVHTSNGQELSLWSPQKCVGP